MVQREEKCVLVFPLSPSAPGRFCFGDFGQHICSSGKLLLVRLAFSLQVLASGLKFQVLFLDTRQI